MLPPCETPSSPRSGWLSAVVPASARLFRVADVEVSEVLADAGAELVDDRPDVEIARLGELRGQAACAVVPVDSGAGDRARGLSLPVRAGERLATSAIVRARAVVARHSLRARGYGATSIVPWEVERRLRVPGRPSDGRRSLVERLPQAALVVGLRSRREPTALEAALDAASEAAGEPVGSERLLAREFGVVAVTDPGIVRVALGPTRRLLDAQRSALDELRAAEPDPIVGSRVPWLRGSGQCGLATWTLERKLPGAAPSLPLTGRIVADCVEFLVALHRAGARGERGVSSADQAEVVAAACGAKEASAVRTLGCRLDAELAHVPRGFGHGDFWSENLLVVGGRLRGVVDWDYASPARLPLLDLLHLRLGAVRLLDPDGWGGAIVSDLLPWARRGGDDVARTYLEGIGLRATAEILVALLRAYWLDRLAYELGTYVDRRERPSFMRRNVELPLRAFAAL